jgi:ATP-dependent phosphoenolpyruvate carboxykinase
MERYSAHGYYVNDSTCVIINLCFNAILITGTWYEAEIQAKPVTANVVLPRSYHRTNGKVAIIVLH